MALQHLHSSTANKRPTPGAMSVGQLAINLNTASPGLFFKDSAGALIKVGPVHVGTTAPNASPASGGETGNTVGEQWLDTTGGTYVFKVWDGSAWRSESGTFVDVNGDVMTGALGIIAGTAGSPGLYISGDTNTGIYSPGADQLALSTSGTQRLAIDSGGNVSLSGPNLSIGGTAPANAGYSNLYVNNTSGAQLFLSVNGSNSRVIYSTATDLNYYISDSSPHIWFTNAAERMRLDSSGRLGIGTSTPVSGAQLTVAGSALAVTGQNLDHSANSIRIGQEGSGAAQIRCYGPNTSTNGSLTFKMSRSDGTNSQDVVIDGSGRLGIGTTTMPADSNLTVLGNFQSGFYRNVSSGARGYVINIGATSPSGFIDGASIVGAVNNGDAGGELLFSTRTSGTVTEKVRIDSSGRLLVGTSTVTTTASTATNNLIALESTNNYSGVSFTANCNDSNGSYLVLKKSRGTSPGSTTVVQSGDEIGNIFFEGTDGSASRSAAAIRAFVDATPGASDMPGRLVFSTTADGASSPTEAMRITSGQNVRIGTTADGSGFSAGRLRLVGNTGGINSFYAEQSTAGGYCYISNAVSNGGTYYHINFFETGTARGSITSNGSATAYNTSSDYRLKENILPMEGATERLLSLKPSRFNFIDFPNRTVDGFIAHEVQSIVPEAITGEKDAVDDEGNPIYQGIDQSKLVPLLTAALQEAIGRIETLEAEVAALKAS